MTHLKRSLKKDDQDKQIVSTWQRGPVESDKRIDNSGVLAKKNLVGSQEQAIQKTGDTTVHRQVTDFFSRYDAALLPHTKLIGIPTMEGIDFLYAHEIIRCEGLQKCTRIVSTRGSAMVSAYNIGEFKKLLEVYGFFSCHKSHLINLMHVKKLTREGFVYLSDNGAVPLARRKRLEFLALLRHL